MCPGKSILALLPIGNLSWVLTSTSHPGSLCLWLFFSTLCPLCIRLTRLSPLCSLTAALSKWQLLCLPHTLSPTYLALGVILLLQHGGHLILKETELCIYLLQEHLPLGRVQKAALDQYLRSTRERPRHEGQGILGSTPPDLPIYSPSRQP